MSSRAIVDSGDGRRWLIRSCKIYFPPSSRFNNNEVIWGMWSESLSRISMKGKRHEIWPTIKHPKHRKNEIRIEFRKHHIEIVQTGIFGFVQNVHSSMIVCGSLGLSEVLCALVWCNKTIFEYKLNSQLFNLTSVYVKSFRHICRSGLLVWI